ncbi:hypothetical protein CPB86DRAFT_188437 [Serendipita vermifera]|nr:hypothetical protein CPB86DRAFT_188437 [Serendipita vermifera]
MGEERIQREKLSNENTRLQANIERLSTENQKLQASLESMKSDADERMKHHVEQIQNSAKHQQEIAASLSACQAELKHANFQVDTLRQQVEATSNAHQQSASDLERAQEHWKSLEEAMKSISKELVDTKSAALDTLKLADTFSNAQQANHDTLLIDSLKSRISDLSEQVEHLTLKNSELEQASNDLVERHKLGMLNEQEAALVRHIVQSTMQVNQRDMVQMGNDIKRRDAVIKGLQGRVMDLEKELAHRLEKKSSPGQLMTMKDIISSSPLTTAPNPNQVCTFLCYEDHTSSSAR